MVVNDRDSGALQFLGANCLTSARWLYGLCRISGPRHPSKTLGARIDQGSQGWRETFSLIKLLSSPQQPNRQLNSLQSVQVWSQTGMQYGFSYFATFTCCPPVVAMLNCSAGVLRDSFLTRARVSQARVVCEEAELCSLSIFWRSRFFFSIASFNLFLARLFIAGLYRVDLNSVRVVSRIPSKVVRCAVNVRRQVLHQPMS